MSGATAARPGLRQLRAGAEAGEFDVLVVESLDRLSRDHADLAWLFREISFLGIRILTVADADVELMHAGVQGLMNALSLKTVAIHNHRAPEKSRNAQCRERGWKYWWIRGCYENYKNK